MPWPVYSERFMHHNGPPSGAPAWLYTVPPKMRAVITMVDAYNQAVAPAGYKVYVGTIYLCGFVFQAVGSQDHIRTAVVAYQGEKIGMEIQKQDLYVSVSGYLFADDSGRTGPPLAAQQWPADPFDPSEHPPALGEWP